MPRRWPILLVGVLAFAALCLGPLVSTHYGQWFSGWSGVGGIEDKLESDANEFLSGLDGHEVVASGQELTVTSTAPLARALQTDLGNLDGVRSVDFRVKPPAPTASEQNDEAPASQPADEAPPAEEPADVAEPADVEEPAAQDAATDEPDSVEPASDEQDEEPALPAPDTAGATAAVAALDLDAVTFEIGTAILTGSAQQSLDDAAAQLAQFQGVAIEVQGHTDTTGDPDVNLLLSQDRANAVVDYLVSAGVDPASLTPKGYGGSRPVADNSTAEGQTANRRVQLVVAEGTN